jgi:putative nucleotidyltransferase with HDIG domain
VADIKEQSFRERMLLTILSVLNPEIIIAVDRMAEVPELLNLAGIISVGENQLHHVLRMSQLAVLIPDPILRELEVDRDDLVLAAIFHDVGKGLEVDDRNFRPESVGKMTVPGQLSRYKGLKWTEWKTPCHDHVTVGYEIGVRYDLKSDILEAVALHHHAKLRPKVIGRLGAGLALTGTVCQDIASYAPEQYAAPGGNLAQVIAFLDQLCALERKLKTNILARYSGDRLEEDVVRDLVIGEIGRASCRERV